MAIMEYGTALTLSRSGLFFSDFLDQAVGGGEGVGGGGAQEAPLSNSGNIKATAVKL